MPGGSIRTSRLDCSSSQNTWLATRPLLVHPSSRSWPMTLTSPVTASNW